MIISIILVNQNLSEEFLEKIFQIYIKDNDYMLSFVESKILYLLVSHPNIPESILWHYIKNNQHLGNDVIYSIAINPKTNSKMLEALKEECNHLRNLSTKIALNPNSDFGDCILAANALNNKVKFSSDEEEKDKEEVIQVFTNRARTLLLSEGWDKETIESLDFLTLLKLLEK